MNMPLVKVISKTGNLQRQLPVACSSWGELRFTLDAKARVYDWLVVYDDIPAPRYRRFWQNPELLACPPENTLLLTHEPSAVKIHGSDFTAQFAAVATCHEPWALRHPNKIASHPASPWWYGLSCGISYDELKARPQPEKYKIISTVCSSKQQRHTLHRRRFAFTRQLQDMLPEIDFFGHGVCFIKDKAEALDDYRYHVVVENHLCPHYWTEKLADAFLANCLPFYCGCPNIADYFPVDSFITIDINNVEETAKIIRRAIADNAYEKRLAAIAEARRRVLDEHNFYALVSRLIQELEKNTPFRRPGQKFIFNRSGLWRKKPIGRLRYLGEKAIARARFMHFYG